MSCNVGDIFRFDGLDLKVIGPESESIVQEIYFHSPTYFQRVEGVEVESGMALKDINDYPPKRGDLYCKVAALIVENSIPIGYADLHIHYRCKAMVYLGLLILREDLQGKGLGRRSYNLIEHFLICHFNPEKIYLGVSHHNRAQNFWAKMGFVENGLTYKYQGDRQESTVTEMEKQLRKPELNIERPSLALCESFLKFVEDMRDNNQPLWSQYLPKESESLSDFVDRLKKREDNPDNSFVPETIYWAVYDGNVVGRISLRHRLEGNLYILGGHVGYEVSPRYRRRGFATEMLRQVLLTDKARAIGKLLLTCSPGNEASNKTILANGGLFSKTVYVDFIAEERNHYWIETIS